MRISSTLLLGAAVLLFATSSPGRADDSTTVLLTAQANDTFDLVDDQDDDTQLVRWFRRGYYRSSYRSFYRGYYGGFSRRYYGGFSRRFYGGFYPRYNYSYRYSYRYSYPRFRYSYSRFNYYPRYSYYYGISADLCDVQQNGGALSLILDDCTPSVDLRTPLPKVDLTPLDNQSFEYQDSPLRRSVEKPTPRTEPAPLPPRRTVPLQGRAVSIPAPKKKSYSFEAYGEEFEKKAKPQSGTVLVNR